MAVEESEPIAGLRLAGLWPSVLDAARKAVGGSWGPLPEHAFSLTALHGGMSNQMFVLAADGVEPRRVVARLLCAQLDELIDRRREAAIVRHLSGGIGPHVYGLDVLTRVVPGGAALHEPVAVRFEAFVDGVTLRSADLHDDGRVLRRMAGVVARFHSEQPCLDGPPSSQPAAPSLGALLRTLCLAAQRIDKRSAPLSSPGVPALRALVGSLDWDRESAWLLRLLEARGGPTVLVHGDLQPGNWMRQDGGDLVVLDFEYSRYDFRAFDLGNLACELAFDYAEPAAPGFRFDGAAGDGSAVGGQRMLAFLEAYAAAVQAGPRGEVETVHPAPPPPPPPVAALLEETRVGMLASHLFWALWSVLMGAGQVGVPWAAAEEAGPSAAGAPAVGHTVFDYVAYGVVRAREFVRLRHGLGLAG